jgi:4-hydroxy-3-methylbut-2-enyl diphosphate reductase
MSLTIKLANPRGFCAGVERAINIVELALETFHTTIYVRHEVVHNITVVNNLKSRGVIFVDELHEVPDNSIVIFSAHGVSPEVEEEAEKRQLTVFDASCPLVKKVHMEVVKFTKLNMECILIGHSGHPEVIGTLGQYKKQTGKNMHLIETKEDAVNLNISPNTKLAYVTQTTLSVDDTKEIVEVLRSKYQDIHTPKKDDICYATQNRQDAVKLLAKEVDLLLVVGSANSSNSTRLKELAIRCGTKAYQIDDETEINKSWLKNIKIIGITAGASAPEHLVQQIIQQIKSWYNCSVEELDAEKENINFMLPKELRLKQLS